MPYPIRFPASSPHVFGGEDLKLACSTHGTQRDSPLHSHDYSELVIVWDGNGRHITETERYRIHGGDVFLIQEGNAHGYNGTAGLTLSNVYFRWESLRIPLEDLPELPGYRALFALEPYLREKHEFRSHLHLDAGDLARAGALVESLRNELTEKRTGWRFSSIACLMDLVVHLCRSYQSAASPHARELMRLSTALSYIDLRLHGEFGRFERTGDVETADFEDSLSVPAIAAAAAVSVRTLQRLFRREIGASPVTYINRLRLDHGRQLLTDAALSALPVTEIAYRCGFTDGNYFTRIFKRRFGVNPRELRHRES